MATILDSLQAIQQSLNAMKDQMNALTGAVITAGQQASDMFRDTKLSEQNAGTAAVNMRDFIINQLRMQLPTVPPWLITNIQKYHLSQDVNGDFIRDDQGNYSISPTP